MRIHMITSVKILLAHRAACIFQLGRSSQDVSTNHDGLDADMAEKLLEDVSIIVLSSGLGHGQMAELGQV